MDRIHLDDFGSDIAVAVDSEYLQSIRDRLRKNCTSMTYFCREVSLSISYSFSYVKNSLKPSAKTMIPLQLCAIVSEKLGVSLYNHVLKYGLIRCRSPVVNPKLPVLHTPILDMLVAHGLADGAVVRSPGRHPYFSFRQHNQRFMASYRKQCEHVFGSIPSLYCGSDPTKTYLPAAPSKVLFHVSGLSENQFLSLSAPMPEYILNKSLDHQFAFLIAFFSDEGHVDSCNLVIRLKNSALVKGLDAICSNLEYSTTQTVYENGMHQLYILSESLPAFFQRWRSLKQKYPFLDLDYKERLLMGILKRMKKPKLFLPGNALRIVKSLQRCPKTVNQLAEEFLITRQGIRYHIQTLMKQGRIQHVQTILGKPPEYVYATWE